MNTREEPVKASFELIPPDNAIEPRAQFLFGEVTELTVTAQEYKDDSVFVRDVFVRQTTELKYDKNSGTREALPSVPAWGYLRLTCQLTGRTASWIMPVEEGHTVNSINQSSVVGGFAKEATRSLTVEVIEDHTCNGVLMIETRSMNYFYKEYSRLELIQIQPSGTVVVHEFYRGKQLKDLDV